MQMKSMAAFALVSGVASSSMAADAVQWRVEDGGNGHWYGTISNVPVSPTSMLQSAAALGASPISVNSAVEQQFLEQQFPQGWILGLHAAAGSNQFVWLSGEPVAYTNWGTGACYSGPYPNNSSATERFVQASHPECSFAWDDYPPSSLGISVWPAMHVEWSADCNNDGLVDYGQIRSGFLADADSDNIPDCCEGQGSCPSVRQWTASSGGNGHWYEVVSTLRTWDAQSVVAESRQGHLATITSASENAFVSQSTVGGCWIGGIAPVNQGCTPSAWTWVTGEPWGYSNWASPEPNYCDERWLEFSATQSGRWNNYYAAVSRGAVVEYESDCNSDGFVDFGQIIGGSLADLDRNFVPDVCESTIHVPSQYATIQAAIDAVPVGVAQVIAVAAGTYNESFRMNGKDVVVRGAPNNATILDGTGLAVSIARMFDGEPATSGLENLVFRGGTSGTPLNPGSTIMVGGAVYLNNSSAFIRNCRFESCRSDFGGAIYHYVGGLAWENCTFVNNVANNEGGAALVYNTTGSVSGCSFTGNQSGVVGPGGGSALKIVGSNGDGETVLVASCTFSGNAAGDSGAAIEIYEHTKYHPVVVRIADSSITGNTSGDPIPEGAAGLRVQGRLQCCILSGSTSICGNAPLNTDGPFLLESPAVACGCFADLNGDGSVNGIDLAEILTAWGPTQPTGAGDVNHDGVVNGADMALLLGAWGACN